MKKILLPPIVLLLVLVIQPKSGNAQLTAAQIDSLVDKTLRTFEVPGIALAIIKDDKVIHSKGYGVRSLNNKQKVDEHTLFGIASNSKAFTTAALAILVDEKNWDGMTKCVIIFLNSNCTILTFQNHLLSVTC